MTIGPCPDLPGMLSEGLCSLWLFQVIQATIEKHKQNSQTFKAFSGSFSQDENSPLTPESPVRASTCWVT